MTQTNSIKLIKTKLMKVFCLIAIFIGSSLFTISSFAACDARVQSVNLMSSGVQNQYDVFATSTFGLVQSYEVKVNFSDPNEDCSLSLMISTVQQGYELTGQGGNLLSFTPYLQTSGSFIQNRHWFAEVSPNQSTFRFQLRFPSQQFGAAGDYSNQLIVQLIPSPEQSSIVLDERNQLISSRIPPVASISFYGLSQRLYPLDLGRLTTGKKVNIDPNLYIRSTTGYEISFRSDNQGKLRHQSKHERWDVDYEFSVAGSVIDFSEAGNQLIVNAPQNPNGQRIPMTIQIGETENRPGGVYEDEIHIDISALGLGGF
ncbi:hypothetical protein Q4591_05640 [Shewanella sp. 3_MG-2023]|uniref:hypothetical protein n=1 Tax=Shewanella sp. 3_MG-2023 TaxID=3062635 RepID=UPI0026E3F30C|nr:hypothetical protein [Shewanella sp. 3_MG-2023]MDO6774833.1 hypothetical protein [Shewanella sp. 3_MG-2023]